MPRFFDRHVAPEILALVSLEMLLSFSLAYIVLAPVASEAFSMAAVNRSVVIAASVGFTSFLLGLYRPQSFMRVRSLLLNTALGGVLAFPAAWLVSSALGINEDWIVGHDRVWPTKILIVWIAALFAVRMAFLLAIRSNLFVRPVVVLGPPALVAGAVASIHASRDGFLQVVAAPGGQTAPAALRAMGVRNALISAESYRALDPALLEAYQAAGIDVEAEPAFWERHLRRVDIDHLTQSWFDELDTNPARRASLPLPVGAWVNRIGDIGISLALLVFTLPLMLLVALLVRVDSTGPVLYRQERVGLGGRSFVLLKFRSMRRDAEARGPAWAQTRDPRVTRVGAFMRRTRIDELPQLINVLRGEMSFIGPRPERPHFVEKLAAAIPHYRERARVKPGLTGWAQVNYPYGASVEDARAKLSYDLFYVKNRSPLLDLLILFATVRVILFQEGAR